MTSLHAWYECTLHMHVSDCDCPEFRDEIFFKEGRM